MQTSSGPPAIEAAGKEAVVLRPPLPFANELTPRQSDITEHVRLGVIGEKGPLGEFLKPLFFFFERFWEVGCKKKLWALGVTVMSNNQPETGKFL